MLVAYLLVRLFPLEITVDTKPLLSMSFFMHWDFGMSSQDMIEMITWPSTLKTSLKVASSFYYIKYCKIVMWLIYCSWCHSNKEHLQWIRHLFSGQENNFNKYNESQSTTQGTPYDYYSVMHYGKNDFSNGNGSTITTKRPEFQDVIGQRLEMSEYDVIELNKRYKCSEYFPQCPLVVCVLLHDC